MPKFIYTVLAALASFLVSGGHTWWASGGHTWWLLSGGHTWW